MPETTNIDPQKIDPRLTARIVRSYVRHHTVGGDQVADLITSVHGALAQLGRPNQPEEALTPAVSVRQSVRPDYVVCLDCGYQTKMLRRHISTRHGLSSAEYLKRWGLKSDHPLTAPAYSEQRSTMAKARDFGRKPKAHVTPAAQASAVADPRTKAKPTRRRSAGSTSKSDVVSEAAAASKPARQSRSRAKGSPATA